MFMGIMEPVREASGPLDEQELPSLPHDVLQHVLRHALDVRTIATARLVSKTWALAVSGAEASIECSLPGNDTEAAHQKLARLHGVAPCSRELRLNVSPGATSEMVVELLNGLDAFHLLSSLELRFNEVLELTAEDATALSALHRLTALALVNVSIPAELDLKPLASGLSGLRTLRLVQNSKVAPLLHGDAALEAVASIYGLEELELRGRMVAIGDAGLLSLRGLTKLYKLTVGWVPWQSQVSQNAALQLLEGLPLLRILKLSGGELLLPAALSSGMAGSMPGAAGPVGTAGPVPSIAALQYVPPPVPAPAPAPAAPALAPAPSFAIGAASAAAAAVGAAPLNGAPAAPAGLAPLEEGAPLPDNLLEGADPSAAAADPAAAGPSAPGGAAAPPPPRLYSMASAPLIGVVGAPRGPAARGPSAQREAAHAANAHLRAAVCAALAHVDDARLRFNCCGTSVEKVLLALGPQMRSRVTGLQWSYAKLGGPLYIKLLGSCLNLRSLKINMWYQDYNQAATVMQLTALAGLSNLETLTIDKRPPFQQALPAQQASVHVPVMPDALKILAQAWPKLAKLHLGLARSDFAPDAFEHLAGFTALRSLTLHSYDTSWFEGPCTLPLNVAHLPPGLVKLDLLHVDLRLEGAAPLASARGSSAGARGTSCGGVANAPGQLVLRSMGTGALPPAASVALPPVSRRPTPALPPAASVVVPGVKKGVFAPPAARSSGCGCGSAAVPPPANPLGAPLPSVPSGGSFSRQTTASPFASMQPGEHAALLEAFPDAQLAAAGEDLANLRSAAPSPSGAAPVQTEGSAAAAAAPPKRTLTASPFAAALAASQAAADAIPSAGSDQIDRTPAPQQQQQQQQQAPLEQHHSTGGFFSSLLPQKSCPASLTKQFSFRGSSKSKGDRSGGGDKRKGASSCGGAPAGPPREGLPALQQLYLKHCTLEGGLTLEDVITNPQELRILQLHEVSGLRAADVALLPELSSLRRLSLIAPRDDTALGLAPLALVSRLAALRHLDWVPSERALPSRLRSSDVQMLLALGHLHVLTLPAALGRSEQLHVLSEQIPVSCQLRLMTPAYCEHPGAPKVSKMQRLLSAASDLFDRATGARSSRTSHAGAAGGGAMADDDE